MDIVWHSLGDDPESAVAYEMAEKLDDAIRSLLSEGAAWGYDVDHTSFSKFPIRTVEGLAEDGAWPPLDRFEQYQPFPSTVGVGVTKMDEESEYHPVLLLEGVSQRVWNIREEDFYWDHVRSALGHHLGPAADALDDFEVFAIPRPLPQAGPGDEVRATMAGTLGAKVTSSGSDAILTAGHVAKSGIAKDASGATIGRVVYSEDPAPPRGKPRTDYADVAVVEIDKSYPLSPGITHSTITASVRPTEKITAFGAISGAKTEEVWLLIKAGKGPPGGGDWSDLMMVKPAISQHGDSGAPVLSAGSDDLVGHVVAGGGNVYTWVQQINTQLNAAGVTLR